jgi:hypothetical protein
MSTLDSSNTDCFEQDGYIPVQYTGSDAGVQRVSGEFLDFIT